MSRFLDEIVNITTLVHSLGFHVCTTNGSAILVPLLVLLVAESRHPRYSIVLW